MHKPFIIQLLIASVLTQGLLNGQETGLLSSASSKKNYDETMKTVSDDISHQEFLQAITLLNDLERDYPDNVDILSKRAALYYWTQSYQASIRDYEKLYALTKVPLYQEEIQKVTNAEQAQRYSEKKNFLSLQRENYSYGGKQPLEKDTTLQAGFKTGDITWIGSGATIDRYNIIDRQFGLEVYSPLGQKDERRWGYLAFYESQNPAFLPRWDVSGGIYQGIFEHSEISLGYRHMRFSNKGVDIFKPGISFPLPIQTLRLTEEISMVPHTHSYAAVTTLSYDPSYRIHGYYTFTTGNSAETFRDETDIRRVNTLSHAVGGTWRFDPSWALGAEVTDGYRTQLYRRTGGKIFLKYFW